MHASLMQAEKQDNLELASIAFAQGEGSA